MADYWKSQPKKFCTYCKCWIADNKPSVEFHERGKNHKENVANKISEIKQKSMEKAKEEAKATKEFAAMEEAALKAYQEDLKRLGSDPVPTGQIATQSVILETQIKRKAEKHAPTRKDETPTRTDEWAVKDEWVEGVSPEGYTYYYNAATGESRWEKPNSIQKSTEDLTKTAETSVWVEAVTEDGQTYYYNAETRESRWEKPEDFVPREDYLPPCSTAPADVSEACTETATTEFESTECAAAVTTESESTETIVTAFKESESTETTVTAFKESESTESTVTAFKESNSDIEDGSKQGKKTEELESAAEGPEHLKEEEIKMQAAKDEDTETEPTLGTSEDVQQHPTVEPVETNVRIARKPTAYGTWEEIKEEEDPYEKVDLELPTVEYDYSEATELNVPQEPKVKFKERTITSLGDAGAIGNPVFKKRKTENGKSRNIRQRISDT